MISRCDLNILWMVQIVPIEVNKHKEYLFGEGARDG